MWKTLTLLFLATTLITGCAGVDHKQIRSEAEDKSNRGIRYYGSSLYLLVYAKSDGSLDVLIMELSDPTKFMSAKMYSFMANSWSTLTFSNGVLTKARDVAETTVFPRAIVTAVETLAPALLAALIKPKITSYEVPAPHLYKIITNGDRIRLVGGPGDVPTPLLVC